MANKKTTKKTTTKKHWNLLNFPKCNNFGDGFNLNSLNEPRWNQKVYQTTFTSVSDKYSRLVWCQEACQPFLIAAFCCWHEPLCLQLHFAVMAKTQLELGCTEKLTEQTHTDWLQPLVFCFYYGCVVAQIHPCCDWHMHTSVTVVKP